jgi:hypothetical protein
MTKLTLYTIFLTLFFISPACKKDTSRNKILSVEDILVKNSEITGWSYSGTSWVANNRSDLTTYIDGGAELYFKYGFVEAAYQKYSGIINNVNCEIQLYVYNLSNSNNTATILDDPDLGLSGATMWSDNPAGTIAKYVRGNGFSQTMFFYRDKYLVDITVTTDNQESLSILKQFAKNVDEKIKLAL